MNTHPDFQRDTIAHTLAMEVAHLAYLIQRQKADEAAIDRYNKAVTAYGEYMTGLFRAMDALKDLGLIDSSDDQD